MSTYYEILGVPTYATELDIRRAYRQLALMFHPDKNPDNEVEAGCKFDELQTAYLVLSDRDRKRAYDRSLRHKARLESKKPKTPPTTGKLRKPKTRYGPSTSKPEIKYPHYYPHKAKSYPSVKADHIASRGTSGNGIYTEYKTKQRFDDMFTKMFKGTKKGEDYRRRLEEEAFNKSFYGRYCYLIDDADKRKMNIRPQTTAKVNIKDANLVENLRSNNSQPPRANPRCFIDEMVDINCEKIREIFQIMTDEDRAENLGKIFIPDD